jgi:hypothetical protein
VGDVCATRVGDEPEGAGGDRGDSEDHSQFWKLRIVWTFWKIGLTSLSKLYLTEIIPVKYYFLYLYFHIVQTHLNLRRI